MSNQLLSIIDLADYLQVSVRHLYRMSVAGKLPPPIRIGRCNRWDLEEVMRCLRAGSPEYQPSDRSRR